MGRPATKRRSKALRHTQPENPRRGHAAFFLDHAGHLRRAGVLLSYVRDTIRHAIRWRLSRGRVLP